MGRMKEEHERILWETARAIEYALDRGLRDDLVDYLEEKERTLLFSGYVLQEHYDCLKQKYEIQKEYNQILKENLDISRVSGKILHGVVNECF